MDAVGSWFYTPESRIYLVLRKLRETDQGRSGLSRAADFRPSLREGGRSGEQHYADEESSPKIQPLRSFRF